MVSRDTDDVWNNGVGARHLPMSLAVAAEDGLHGGEEKFYSVSEKSKLLNAWVVLREEKPVNA